MRCQSLFSGKNKNTSSKGQVLKVLPSILSVNAVIILLETFYKINLELVNSEISIIHSTYIYLVLNI